MPSTAERRLKLYLLSFFYDHLSVAGGAYVGLVIARLANQFRSQIWKFFLSASSFLAQLATYINRDALPRYALEASNPTTLTERRRVRVYMAQVRLCLYIFVVTTLLSGSIAASGVRKLDRDLRELLKDHSKGQGLAYFKLPRSLEFWKIPQDPNNPLTLAKVILGKRLYHETALAVNNVRDEGYETYACASCHFAQAGFMANSPQGIGDGGVGFGVAGEGRDFNPNYEKEKAWDIQAIRSPTVLNGAYQALMLWNGQFGGVGANNKWDTDWETLGFPLAVNALGFQGLETQAIAGMQVHRQLSTNESIDADLLKYRGYRALFKVAFPDDPDPYTQKNAALAIAAYERTVLANQAPFQKWLRGSVHAMTDQQKRGALVFFGKGRCVACHTGPALNSMTFHALGMNDLDGSYDSDGVELSPFNDTIPEDVRKGRGGFIAKLTPEGESDEDYKFKTPQLYNLTDSPFYGHGASFASVREVVEYKNNASAENADVPAEKLSEFMQGESLGLFDREIDDLVTFIEEALYDPNLMRYVPKRLPSGNCTPVNDPQAQTDLIENGYCKGNVAKDAGVPERQVL